MDGLLDIVLSPLGAVIAGLVFLVIGFMFAFVNYKLLSSIAYGLGGGTIAFVGFAFLAYHLAGLLPHQIEWLWALCCIVSIGISWTLQFWLKPRSTVHEVEWEEQQQMQQGEDD